MSRDLGDLLQATAVGPSEPLDTARVVRRGRRRRWLRRGAMGGVAVSTLVMVTLVVGAPSPDVDVDVDVGPGPVATQPPDELPDDAVEEPPDGGADAHEDLEVISPEDADLDLLLFGDHGIARVVAGERQPIWAEPVDRAHSDQSGGVVFQDAAVRDIPDGPGPTAIRWLRPDGSLITLVDADERPWLHNVIPVDGQPTVFFTRSHDDVDDTRTLHALELPGRAEQTLPWRGGGESGLDGIAASSRGLLTSGCHLQCVITPLDDPGERLVGPDWISGFDAAGDHIAYLEFTFAPETGDLHTPVLVVASLDNGRVVRVRLPDEIRGAAFVALSNDARTVAVWSRPYLTGELTRPVIVDRLDDDRPRKRLLTITTGLQLT